MSGVLLKSAGESVNDLGIIFERCLKFNAHLEKISCKTMTILGFLLRISMNFKLSSS